MISDSYAIEIVKAGVLNATENQIHDLADWQTVKMFKDSAHFFRNMDLNRKLVKAQQLIKAQEVEIRALSRRIK